MGFESDTVQGMSISEELFGNLDQGERLVVGRFDIVVVDVQLDIGGGSVGNVELYVNRGSCLKAE